VATIMAGSLFAGGLALENIFELRFADDIAWPITWLAQI